MAVNPCFQVIVVQVYAVTIFPLINKGIVVGQQVVVKYHDGCARLDMCQVIFQPVTYIFRGIFGTGISVRHGGNDVMHSRHIKGIIDRPIDAFKDFFSIFSPFQIMVSDAIKHRYVHVFRIHQLDMRFQSLFVADVSGVDDEGCLFVGGIVAHIAHPVFMVAGIEYLGIGNMDKPVRTVFSYARIIGYQTEIVFFFLVFYFVIMAVHRFVARRGSDEDEFFTMMSRQGISSVRSGFYHIQSVGYFNPFQSLFSLVPRAVVIFVHKDSSVVGSG